jgi:hypothetical protein
MLSLQSSLTKYVIVGSIVLVFFITTLSNSVFGAGTRFDFDGDARADLSVFRPSNGWWYLYNSSNGFQAYRFGQDGDQTVAHDYDGDGKTDAAVFRQGIWYRLRSSTNTYDAVSWGVPGDMPVPADLDGDGRADMVVFRPSTNQWFAISSQTGEFSIRAFGAAGDIPVPADFDGDHIADIAVFRPSNGTWYRINSANGGSYVVRQFGQTGDIPLTGDFDGDGRSDLAVWRPSNSNWYFQTDNSFWAVNFGVSTDTPVPADYDGDGIADISVYRPGTGSWYRINSATSSFQAQNFGIEADIPAASPIIPPPTPPPTPTPSPTATPTPSPTPASFTCDYFASPSGTASGSGSITSPWNLQTALNKTALITSGKTLCLRGGTYFGKFRSTLNGGTVRSYPGEWAKIDGNVTTILGEAVDSTQQFITLASSAGLFSGATIAIDNETIQIDYVLADNTVHVNRHWDGSTAVDHINGAVVSIMGSGPQLYVAGSNTVYRDFEITNSSTTSRNGWARANNRLINRIRGGGITAQGNGNSYINLIIHDNAGGIFTGSSSSNTLFYGCLVFNEGMFNPADGHGLYLENSSGYSRVYETLVLNNFNLGIQAYGVTGPYVGGDMRGVVVAGSGSPIGEYHWNLLYGPGQQASPTANVQESVFYLSPGHGYSVHFGYGAGITSGAVTNNYFLGSETSFEARAVTNLVFTNNKFDSDNANTHYAFAKLGYTWDNNTYYNTTTASTSRLAELVNYGYVNFANWKLNTHYDTTGTISNTRMPDTVIVRPNIYETGRANIIVYAPSTPGSINLNLSTTGLVNGQAYTIKNAFNYNGPSVLNGIYNSGSPIVSVPLNGAAATVATPIGMQTTPITSSPTFSVLIIKPS